MIGFYAFCVIASLLIYILICIADVKRSLFQNIMVLLTAMSNIGYLSLALSTQTNEALLSMKIVYLGGCFLPLLYFFTVCEVCHVELKKIFKAGTLLLQGGLFCCVCTIGFTDLYYKNVHFKVVEGVGHLTKEYGPMHVFYPLTMYGYFIASVVMAIWAFYQKKTVNRKELINMLGAAGLAAMSYGVYRIMRINVDIMAFSYIVLMLGGLIPVYHSNVYTVIENKDIIHEHLNRVGFITFNTKMGYMGANEYALNILDELKECEVGKKVFQPSPTVSKLIGQIEEFHKSIRNQKGHEHVRTQKIEIADKIFDTEIHTLNNFRGKCLGYTLELVDETEHYKMLELTEKYNEELSAEVEEKTEKIRMIQQNTILGMAQMVESRDLSTGGHVRRTSDVVKIFAKKLLKENMGLDRHFLKLVIRSAPMHDLGKIGVDDAVLRKQGKFSDEEYEMMKKHAEIGGRMVRDILSGVEEDDFVQVAFHVANYHHEKVNGKGYPCGLKGDEIPVEARIMALADVFDALVSKRCYKEAFSYDKAFSIIEADAGEHFDAKLAAVFLKCKEELIEYYNKN